MSAAETEKSGKNKGLKFTNTLTREKEVFRAIDDQNVRLYVCGPTVYDFAHIGNARPVIVFDVLYRLLQHVYGPDHVTYARNITDVDDKINARALRDHPELPLNDAIARVTQRTADQFHKDIEALNVLPPDHEPRATQHIDGMVEMIQLLIEKGHAYQAEGEVLFDTASMPDYGGLSKRKLDEQIAGARIAVDAHKKNPGDFVLWKLSTDEEPGWQSPWGRGRPGWHIECSVMSAHHLGKVFDIHGGGLDLIFPHHENEIAQSCCANPEGDFARYWVHNEMLQVEGKKMSKSLGNFFTIRDLLDQGIPGEVVRFVMLGTHYGKTMDWTDKRRGEADATLRKWYGILHGHGFGPKLIAALQAEGQWDADPEFLGVLANDLNTPGALARLHVLSKGKTPAALARFAHGLDMLGLVADWSAIPMFDGGEAGPDVAPAIAAHVDALLADRAKARAAKDWTRADEVRDILNAAGVQVTDVGGQATWVPGPDFDAAKLGDI